MKKLSFFYDKYFWINFSLCFIAIAITIAVTISGAYIQEGYNLNIGSISPVRFVAPTEVVDNIATERKINEAVNSVVPLLKMDKQISRYVLEELDLILEDMDKIRIEYIIKKDGGLSKNKPLMDDISMGSADMPIGSPVSDTSSASDELANTERTHTSIFLTDEQYEVYSILTNDDAEEFKNDLRRITAAIMEQGVKEELDTKSYLYARDELNNLDLTVKLKDLGYSIISTILQPNIIVDEEATQAAKDLKKSEVTPIVYLKNQRIVDKDEIVTQEIYAILDSLNLIKSNNKTNLIPILGSAIFILIMHIFLYVYIFTFNKKLITNTKDSLLLFTLYICVIFLLRAAINVPYIIIPVTIFSMLVAILLDQRLAIVLNIFVTLTGSFIYKGDSGFILFFLISGTFSATLTKLTYERNKVILAGVLLGIVNILTTIAISLFYDKNFSDQLPGNVLFSLLNGLLSVIITIGSLPIWEALFDSITPIKLLDLVNPDKKLLRRLALEAPGTYHHSLIVANLAETAAYEIDANATLARVGGYYHDIGKLKQPQYFAENQIGENPHDKLKPEESTKIILEHVTYGQKIANENKLPRAVKDVIVQHHGSSLVKYFYSKAIKEHGAENVDRKNYCYPGIKPQSKEAAIVMLADTIEASVRSMMPTFKNSKEVDAFMQKMIKDKLDENQLDDSLLTIKDLEVIRTAFMQIISGMYHERIAYPSEVKSSPEKTDPAGETAPIVTGDISPETT